MEQFDSKLSSVINSTLGMRCRLSGYQYFDRNLQLGWGFFQHIIDVLVDGFYLTADRTNGIAFRNLDFIEEDVLDRVRNPD